MPTLIYRDPLDNLPVEVRAGALETLRASLNERNRASKEQRLGFSTSEDAVTWTVFSWLATRAPAGLARLGSRLFLASVPAPAVLLWGVPVPADTPCDLRARITRLLDGLGETPASRTEPDVILDHGSHGLALIEVKLHAANDVQPPEHARKFERYVRDSMAFADPDGAARSGHYELARNWRLGHDLAGERPFRLVNLGPPKLFEGRAGPRLDAFEATLAHAGDRSFVRLTWAEFLADTRAATGPLPSWLVAWLAQRGLPA